MTSPYSTRHMRVLEARGRAAEQKCIDCNEQACDWSQRQGTDGESPEDYDPRCKPCHFDYDDIGGQISRAKKGVKQTPEHRAAIAAGMVKAGPRPRSQKQIEQLAKARLNSPKFKNFKRESGSD